MQCTRNINNSFTQWQIYNNITKPAASPPFPLPELCHLYLSLKVWINYFSSRSHLIFSPSPSFHFHMLIFNPFSLANMSGLVCSNYMGFVLPWVGFLIKFSVFSVNLCGWLPWLFIVMGFATAFFVPFTEYLQLCLIHHHNQNHYSALLIISCCVSFHVYISSFSFTLIF